MSGMFAMLVSKAFQAADKDNSGFIDREEIEVALNKFAKDLKLDKVTKEDVDKYFIELDKDSNGVIDEKEFGKLIQIMIRMKREKKSNK